MQHEKVLTARVTCLRPGIPLRFCGYLIPALFDKRISNRQLPDALPVLKVLGIKDGATGSQRGGYDEGVVDRKTEIARDVDCRLVQLEGQRLRRIEENFQYAEGLMDFVPAAFLLAT